MERRAGLGGRLVVAGFTGACQNASLGWRPASGGGRRGRLSAQQGDLISGLKELDLLDTRLPIDTCLY